MGNLAVSGALTGGSAVDLHQLLRMTVEKNASDLHLKVGRPPLFRVAGDLVADETLPPVTEMEIQAEMFRLMPEQSVDRFRNELEADVAYDYEGVARFRVNIFFQRGKIGAVLRRIPLDIPSIESLGLPPVLKELALRQQGWILIAGPTGSGKSTTMAALVEYINQNSHCHIVTIEDPVEFIYTDKKATINQRQIGIDTLSFDEALRRVLRQDPDVILMGEMRDAKSMETAMHAAETGHLVFSTIHTTDTEQTLDRVLDVFSADMSKQIRQLFAQTLAGIVAQKLIRRKDNTGMVAAIEILINSPHMSQLLAEGKIGDIQDALQKGGDYYQMQSFNQDLARLVTEEVITAEDALSYSSNPGDLKLLLRGVGTGSSNIRRMQKEDRDKNGRKSAAPPAPGDAKAPDTPDAAVPPEKPSPKPDPETVRKLADNKGYDQR